MRNVTTYHNDYTGKQDSNLQLLTLTQAHYQIMLFPDDIDIISYVYNNYIIYLLDCQ